jgi:isopentenyl-diphosphate delta-isomerase
MSSHDPSVVLVDGQDRELGLMARSLAHRGQGHRHRAFTALVFDEQGRLLLARRAAHKTLWPGCYDGTVASHPRAGEALPAAAQRRLREELGLDLEPKPFGRFDYRVADGSRGTENELCWALWAVLPATSQPHPDPREIDRLEWLHPAELLATPARWPSICPWLWPALACLAGPPRAPQVAAQGTALPEVLQKLQGRLRRGSVLELERALLQAFHGGTWQLV